MANSPPSNIYGRDLVCTPNADGVLDLTPEMNEATGIDVLVQSIVRRHLTAKGSDRASPNDGIDVRAYLKAGLTQSALSLLATQVQQELIRDQRVLPATTVSATYNPETLVVTFNEVIVPSQAAPFSLTIAISAVSVDVIVGSM